MKISQNWLSEFVDIKSISVETIGESLTLHTAELEEIFFQTPFFEKVFAGKFIERRDHKDSDKLSVGTFDFGEVIGKKQILYGKVHEIAVGDILPIAMDTKLQSGIEISAAEIRGEKSEGMIADNLELGLKNEGLLRFTENEIGKNLVEICDEFGDALFDIDNKSLTHRPDLMGHRGFALELSAIFGKKLTLPEPAVAVPRGLQELPVEVETKRCHRFTGIAISNVTIEQSPLSTQIRLENLGVRAISNFVDITNLIMQEFGQPMHVFDADKVSGKIIVRQAKKGEKLIALDGGEYELTPEDMVIADEEKVLSIAGIMGGLDSGVTENTENVIFESANFEPVSIRKTSQRLGLRSESSMRFEKSLDPAQCKRALFAAVEIAMEVSRKCKITSNVGDVWTNPPARKVIFLDPKKVRSHSGLDLSNDEIKQKLESVCFDVLNDPKGGFQVKVPSNRGTKDVNIAEDLIEEVVRLHGFSDIKAQLPTLPITPPRQNYQRNLEWKMKDFIAGRGFLEVYNYDFVNAQDADFTGSTNYTEIANPLSSEYTHLRQTLISNLVKNLESELRTNGTVQLFEFGKTYEEIGNVLPKEELKMALFLAKLEGDESASFFELKTELEQVFVNLKIVDNLSFRPISEANLKPYFHPSKTAEICCGEEVIGIISVLHPQYLEVKGSHVVFSEISVELINDLVQSQDTKYKRLSTFPPVYRDLSIVLADTHLMGEIESMALDVAPGLKKIELFDEYKDDAKLGKGLKNLAFHLEFRSSEKTLEEGDIDQNFSAIVDTLDKKLGAKLRMEFDKTRV